MNGLAEANDRHELGEGGRGSLCGTPPNFAAPLDEIAAELAAQAQWVVELSGELEGSLQAVCAADRRFCCLLEVAGLPAPRVVLAELLADLLLARMQALEPFVPARIPVVVDRAERAIAAYGRRSCASLASQKAPK